MPPEVLAHALEPFFTTKKKAMAYGIAKQHGGHLSVESAENIVFDDQNVHPRPGHGDDLRTRARPPKFGALPREGKLLSETAHDAVEAQRLLAMPSRFDLVVSDLVMSGQDGDELARELLADHQNLKILLISGYAPRAEVVHSLDPRVRFLAKPFTSAELYKKLEELMEVHADAADADASADRNWAG